MRGERLLAFRGEWFECYFFSVFSRAIMAEGTRSAMSRVSRCVGGEGKSKWNTTNRSWCAQVINERNDFITFSLIFHRFNGRGLGGCTWKAEWNWPYGKRSNGIDWCFTGIHSPCKSALKGNVDGNLRRRDTVSCRLSIAKGYFLSIYVISSDFCHSFRTETLSGIRLSKVELCAEFEIV